MDLDKLESLNSTPEPGGADRRTDKDSISSNSPFRKVKVVSVDSLLSEPLSNLFYLKGPTLVSMS